MNGKETYKDVTAIVEATPYESLCLWEKWHQQKGYTWEESGSGPLITVGHLDGRPICIAPLVHTVNGRKIMFLEVTSTVVDWKMIDNWLYENIVGARKGTGMNCVTAQNFHNIVH